MSEREGYRERGEVKKVSVLLMHACVSFQNLALWSLCISSGSWGQLGQETRYIYMYMYITSCKEYTCLNGEVIAA